MVAGSAWPVSTEIRYSAICIDEIAIKLRAE
jgi:hypothetical protein